ncbi:UDP-Glycosyltransferase superfamily protein [Euphorbia peplus]|nr:UDP-Glycosyltransferase superfamily protein [Euphorbia peplus]
MGSISIARNDHKAHIVCVPYPSQGHINPMLQLAKLLHRNNCHVTFVNTHHIHTRLLKSRGSNALDGLPDFQFKTIPDGLPPSEANATQDSTSICDSTSKHCLVPFLDLLSKLSSDDDLPPVTCILADACMSFTLDAAHKLGVSSVLFWTQSACGVLGFQQFDILLEKGIIPLQDPSYLTNGFLETTIDWIPAMKNIQLKYLPSFFRATDRNDIMLNFIEREITRTTRASALIFNTFDAFEQNVLDSLSLIFPPIYTLGPLQLLVDQIPSRNLQNLKSNLWEEHPECTQWLDSKEENSVLYVNFGSIAIITEEQMTELAWGLANSNKSFLWIIRPDLVAGKRAMLPSAFVSKTEHRGMLASWCNQEEILKHPAVGGFLSHMGWNSTLDSICGGVPMICLPFVAEQQTNCWFACGEWGVGMEIGSDVDREEVEKVVRKLMDGDKGKVVRKKAMEWKIKAEEATRPGGTSYTNLGKFIKFVQSKQVYN